MLKKTLRAALCALILAIAPNVSAAPEIIEADGVYMMGDNDTPKSARDAARNEAMRAATERAGVYIESVSEVQDYALTRDEIRMVAAAVLRVLNEQVTPELVGDAWRYRVHLVCSVDTDGIDLAALAGDKAELARLTQERDALQRENDDLRSRPTMPRGAVLIPPAPIYGKTGGVRVPVYGEEPPTHAPTPIENIFADVEAMILRGENDHAVADLSLLLQDPSVTGDARAYAYVLRGRAYYAQPTPRACGLRCGGAHAAHRRGISHLAALRVPRADRVRCRALGGCRQRPHECMGCLGQDRRRTPHASAPRRAPCRAGAPPSRARGRRRAQPGRRCRSVSRTTYVQEKGFRIYRTFLLNLTQAFHSSIL